MDRNRSGTQRWLPVVYLGLTLAAVAFVLPTALRPPNDQPPAAAEFDPDAPPDEDPEAILASLSRGSSATAGAGPEAAGPGEATARASPVKPRGCPLGFGVPPRQTESLYSPACAPAFTGDNFGATYKGVTANEIRLGVTYSGGAGASYTGFVPDEGQSGESQVDYTVRMLQRYFNQAYQLYGRRLRFVTSTGGGTRATAVDMDERFKIFGASNSGSEGQVIYNDELARRKLVSTLWWAPGDFFDAREPYVWGWNPDTTRVLRLASEFICKQLAGKTARHAGDPVLARQTRTFGFVHVSDGFASSYGPELAKFLSDDCGVRVVHKAYGSVSIEQASTAIAALRVEGVNTVMLAGNFVFMATTHAAATNNGFFPEWLHFGPGSDTNTEGHLGGQPQQLRHAYGMTFSHIPQRWADMDCVRAIRLVDPGGRQPSGVWCYYLFPQLQQLVGGIQLAGPVLNPQTFAAGMYRKGYEFWPDLVWPVGGGYGPGDQTYPDDAALMWWDPTAEDPCPQCNPLSTGDNERGAWRFSQSGRRFLPGSLPRQDPDVFADGITHPS